MHRIRRFALSALPKFALSRTTGRLARVPLPRLFRGPLFRLFAWRYGADLGEMNGALDDFRDFATFFRRPLRPGTRPVGETPLVWPCDGRIITSGPIRGGRIPQVKGRDYALAALLQDAGLAAAVEGGTQATVYLAPGDYHRVHSPMAGTIAGLRHIPGALFPVNPGAVDCIPDLFPRNERVVFHYRLDGPDGVDAAVVLVSALNVGDTLISRSSGPVARGDEIGQFGFGSTVIVLLPAGGPAFVELPRETVVRCGAAVGEGSLRPDLRSGSSSAPLPRP